MEGKNNMAKAFKRPDGRKIDERGPIVLLKFKERKVGQTIHGLHLLLGEEVTVSRKIEEGKYEVVRGILTYNKQGSAKFDRSKMPGFYIDDHHIPRDTLSGGNITWGTVDLGSNYNGDLFINAEDRREVTIR